MRQHVMHVMHAMAWVALGATGCGAPAYKPNTAPTYDNHPYFPIGTTDSHHGIECSECHSTADTFKIINCTGCHEHTEAVETASHQDVPGFVYNAANCYGCHPHPAAGAP